MARILLFGDEAGDFNFSDHPQASEYFILTTVAFFDDASSCRDLDRLRHQLAWEGEGHPGMFHATMDKQRVRDRVFAELASHQFRVDATLLQKRKARPQLRQNRERFYQYAWYYHLKRLAPRICRSTDEMLAIAASIGTKKERGAFHRGVADVVAQTVPGINAKSANWPSAVDTGLQIADYCCWAVQRKWESGDNRSYTTIASKIKSEFDLFRNGTTAYY